MEIILKQAVPNLGEMDEIVKVRPGYARNFLFPKRFAVLATESAKKVMAETMKQREHKVKKMVMEAQQIADTLKDVTLQIAVKVGENGKIFGSVNNSMVAEALKAKGYEIDKRMISLPEDHIKMIGTYAAHISLNKEVKFDLNFEVVPEA
ncbi:MAG: 50S ribosomal protein L9 [Bacteroidota bacterium]